MGADKSAENTPNAPKIICPKVWDFDEKRLHWVSEVRAPADTNKNHNVSKFKCKRNNGFI